MTYREHEDILEWANKQIADNRARSEAQQEQWDRQRKEQMEWLDKQRKESREQYERQMNLLLKLSEQRNPTDCPRCGAPLHGKVCEYCGSKF